MRLCGSSGREQTGTSDRKTRAAAQCARHRGGHASASTFSGPSTPPNAGGESTGHEPALAEQQQQFAVDRVIGR